jgi:hypothetical protein
MALGVPAETAEEDYRGSENKEQIAELRHMIAATQGVDPSEVDPAMLSPLFYVEPSYFEAILDEINR